MGACDEARKITNGFGKMEATGNLGKKKQKPVSVEQSMDWVGARLEGVGSGIGGKELVVACVDNFWSKPGQEGGLRNGAGAGRTCKGLGFGRLGECWWYICVLMRKVGGEGVVDKSSGLVRLSKSPGGLWGKIWPFLEEGHFFLGSRVQVPVRGR